MILCKACFHATVLAKATKKYSFLSIIIKHKKSCANIRIDANENVWKRTHRNITISMPQCVAQLILCSCSVFNIFSTFKSINFHGKKSSNAQLFSDCMFWRKNWLCFLSERLPRVIKTRKSAKGKLWKVQISIYFNQENFIFL